LKTETNDRIDELNIAITFIKKRLERAQSNLHVLEATCVLWLRREIYTRPYFDGKASIRQSSKIYGPSKSIAFCRSYILVRVDSTALPTVAISHVNALVLPSTKLFENTHKTRAQQMKQRAELPRKCESE
jgi:hypothetical protein